MTPEEVLQVLKNGLDKATRHGSFTFDEVASLHNGVKALNDYLNQIKIERENMAKDNSELEVKSHNKTMINN